MQIINSISKMQATTKAIKFKKTIALVPTMGNLHLGHLKLIELAKQHSDFVVVSIFVNPMQFAPNEDFASYPRTLDADIQKLKNLNIDVVFCPNKNEMYPDGEDDCTNVIVPKLSFSHCAKTRPHFFTGVASVVLKLFNIVNNDIAVFGEKDYQQLQVIKKMVKDLNLDINVLPHEIVREESGLAMSSRNNYLNAEQKDRASIIYKTLCTMRDKIISGVSDYKAIEEYAKDIFAMNNLQSDYLNICDKSTLSTPRDNQNLIILAAVYLNNVRLIDNVSIN